MHDKWYYQVMGQVVGLLSLEDLHRTLGEKRLGEDTLVRDGDNGDWVLADRLPKPPPTKPSRQRQQPPPPPSSATMATPQQLQTSAASASAPTAVVTKSTHSSRPKRKRTIIAVIGILMVVALAGVSSTFLLKRPKDPLQEFRPILLSINSRIATPKNVYLQSERSGKWYRYSSHYSDARFDVKKTDSLAMPIVGLATVVEERREWSKSDRTWQTFDTKEEAEAAEAWRHPFSEPKNVTTLSARWIWNTTEEAWVSDEGCGRFPFSDVEAIFVPKH
jgi:hypothetical protein